MRGGSAWKGDERLPEMRAEQPPLTDPALDLSHDERARAATL